LDRAAQLDLAYRRGGELIGPLLFLEVRDGSGVAARLLLRLRERRLLVGEDRADPEIVTIAQAGRIDGECPLVSAGRGRHTLDAKGSRSERRRPGEYRGRTARFGGEGHRRLAGVQRLEVVERRKGEGKRGPLTGHEGGVFHEQLGFVRPAGDVEGWSLVFRRRGLLAAAANRRTDGDHPDPKNVSCCHHRISHPLTTSNS